MTRSTLFGGLAAMCAAALFVTATFSVSHAIADGGDLGVAPTTKPATQPTSQPAVKINLDKAVAATLPEIKEDLKAEAFKTADGKQGWAIRIPGNRPIATPAYAEIGGTGMLFLGGGYGSHEFYAFDAETGKVVWRMQTGDDGPTAAVVESLGDVPYVAFNTESCTVIIADARTGKVIWQEWLGDPLMSQPAIADGKLYIAYPGGAPRGAQLGADPGRHIDVPNAPAANANASANANANGQPQTAQLKDSAAPPTTAPAPPAAAVANDVKSTGGAAVGPATGHGHRLLCADLKTGKHLWEQDITGDVISAPIIDGSQVLMTCFDGTSFCLDVRDGHVVWKKANAGTSAPIVASNGQVVITQKQVATPAAGGQVQEGIKRLQSNGEEKDKLLLASGDAPYLKKGNDGNVAGFASTQQAMHDSTVGFSVAPQAAALDKAASNVNVTTVAGGWAYQGSRAAYANGAIINAQNRFFNCVDAESGQVRWRGEATGKDVNGEVQAFAPPALGAKNLYVASAQGHLLSINQKDGRVNFVYATGQPMAFQPALAKGNVYAVTAGGMLICLKTGDKDADGWTAWGGNAQHNKKQ